MPKTYEDDTVRRARLKREPFLLIHSVIVQIIGFNSETGFHHFMDKQFPAFSDRKPAGGSGSDYNTEWGFKRSIYVFYLLFFSLSVWGSVCKMLYLSPNFGMTL